MSEFASPASSVGINYSEVLNSLLLIEVIGLETAIPTSLGDKDAVRANVYVLDGAGTGDEYEDVLIFPRVLISQLRPRIGQKVLARLTQGQAKPGQNPPWKLAEATSHDQGIAQRWLNQRNKPQAPASPQDDDIPF